MFYAELTSTVMSGRKKKKKKDKNKKEEGGKNEERKRKKLQKLQGKYNRYRQLHFKTYDESERENITDVVTKVFTAFSTPP